MELNLMPSVAKFQAEKIKFSERIKSMTISLLVVWVAVLVVVMAVYLFFKFNYSNVNNKYEVLLKDYKKMAEDVIINQELRYKAKLVGQVLDKRFEYSVAFAKMNSLFGEDVVIEEMNLDGNSTVSITAYVLGGDAMDRIEAQIMDINNGLVDGFSNAVLGSIGLDGNKWSFSMEVDLFI